MLYFAVLKILSVGRLFMPKHLLGAVKPFGASHHEDKLQLTVVASTKIEQIATT